MLKHSNSISVSSDAHTSRVKISLCNSFEGSIDGACNDGVRSSAHAGYWLSSVFFKHKIIRPKNIL